MGCLDVLTSLMGVSSAAKAEQAEQQRRKMGKSPEQKRAIDFFSDDGLGGCLSGKNKKLFNPYTMTEYQKLVSDKCAALNVKAKALQKIGLDESQISEIAPIVLSAYRYDDDCLIRISDGVAVSSQFSISWIFFSSTQLYTYTYIFSTVSDDTWEFTKEYFYSDITSINTLRMVKEKIDHTIIGGGCFKKEKETASKNNYVIDQLEIIVPGSSYSFEMRNSTTVERSIQGAKAMIREKKYMK